MPNISKRAQQTIDDKWDENFNILFEDTTLDGSNAFTYGSQSGISMNSGESNIQVKSNSINVNSDGKGLSIDGENTKLGNLGQSLEPTILGSNFKKYFSELSDIFNKLKELCSGSETTPLKGPIQEICMKLKDIDKLLTKNVKVN